MASQRDKLIDDLLKIYMKYDAVEIAAALDALKSGEALRQFTELGSEVAFFSRTEAARREQRNSSSRPKRAHRNPRAALDKIISNFLDATDPIHHQIAAVLKAAIAGEILYSSAILRRFFLAIGLPVSSKRDRISMLCALAEHLGNLPQGEALPILRMAMETGKQESSLQRWTDIIVQKNRT